MNLRQRFILAAVVVVPALGAWAAPADAAPITFNFTGTITQVNLDPDVPIEGAPTFGTPFSGSYTFESTSVDLIAQPGSGSYSSPQGPPSQFVVEIGGGTSRTVNFVNIGVFDGASSDTYSVLACGDPLCSSLVLGLDFLDLDGTALASDALPLDAPPFAAFELAQFTFRSVNELLQAEFLGQVTSLTCVDGCAPTPAPTPVPEPATVVLCATGLIASVFRRRGFSIFGRSQE
jgi:hypothetical protein